VIVCDEDQPHCPPRGHPGGCLPRGPGLAGGAGLPHRPAHGRFRGGGSGEYHV
jgi:hypothetical protein